MSPIRGSRQGCTPLPSGHCISTLYRLRCLPRGFTNRTSFSSLKTDTRRRQSCVRDTIHDLVPVSPFPGHLDLKFLSFLSLSSFSFSFSLFFLSYGPPSFFDNSCNLNVKEFAFSFSQKQTKQVQNGQAKTKRTMFFHSTKRSLRPSFYSIIHLLTYVYDYLFNPGNILPT